MKTCTLFTAEPYAITQLISSSATRGHYSGSGKERKSRKRQRGRPTVKDIEKERKVARERDRKTERKRYLSSVEAVVLYKIYADK